MKTGVIATTGFFDGVHFGHRKVLDNVLGVARERGCRSAVITFWPHPRAVLRQDSRQLRLLTSLEEKKTLLAEAGIDDVHVVEFTREFSRLSCEQFLKRAVAEYGIEALVIGHDHRLGCSDCDTDIERVAASIGLETIRTAALDDETDRAISSTYIREVISRGDMRRSASLLGRDYSLSGVVVAGNGIGRSLNFPTANMKLYEPLKLVPANGVYAVRVLSEGKWYEGVCNIGQRPTIGDGRGIVIETHILDFNEDIYGLDIKVEFVEKLRDECKFDSLQLLCDQLRRDVVKAREVLSC
ncbi:MAG: riboflavin biosynthesis protein RibF [Bacteroidales bacterium]|nr:riboflavin biosynthesis protein RibF [Bacteroidales bacterium]